MLSILRRTWPMCAALACALPLATPLAALAAGNAPTPEQTLNDDVLGPRVDWHGAIERAIANGDETCFILQRLTDNGYVQIAGTRFIACNLGIFNPDRFAPGKILNVVGNLGAAQPRTIGGHVFDYPLVASAEIRLAGRPTPNYYRDGGYPYSYGPRPGWGPGFGYGLYYSR